MCSWYPVLVLHSCNYDCDLLKSLLLRNFAATATLKILLLELLHRRWFVLDQQDTKLGNRHNILSHNNRLLWTFLSFCRGSRQGAFNRHRVIEKNLFISNVQVVIFAVSCHSGLKNTLCIDFCFGKPSVLNPLTPRGDQLETPTYNIITLSSK